MRNEGLKKIANAFDDAEMNLIPYSSLRNLMLLPKQYQVEQDYPIVQRILKISDVFQKMHDLEQRIQPILSAIAANGIFISNEWFTEGLKPKRDELDQVIREIAEYVIIQGNATGEVPLEAFWSENHLPIAHNYDELSKYRRLHPTYGLVLKYKKQQQFLLQWGERLLTDGIQHEDGVLLKGEWLSYASYSGRIFAKKLPLTSIPKEMRRFVLSPEGYQTLSLDLNNAELRFLAYYARCETMLNQFEGQQDVHALTGKLITKVLQVEELCDDALARSAGKQYAFSMLYGAKDATIVQSFRKQFPNATSADVARINNEFNRMYPQLQIFFSQMQQSEKLLTPFGKIRPLVKFSRTQKRNFALQSSVAVAVKILMIVASQYFKVVHVVHDEIWIHAPTREPTALIEEMVKKYYEQLDALLPGFPVKRLLQVEKIGGNNHVKKGK